MNRPQNLDFDGILARLQARGMGGAVLPQVQEAIAAHAGEEGGASLEFEDLLLHLSQLGHSRAAHLLLEETGAWLRDLPGAEELLARRWRENGARPHAPGYGEARQRTLRASLRAPAAEPYGRGAAGLDERVVEYPWTFDRLERLHPRGASALDAGSTLNHDLVLEEWRRRDLGPLSIVTLCFEGHASVDDRVRYEFADLRTLPYRDGWFSTVLCLSTMEHVGMDNGLYGDRQDRATDPARETARAMDELHRVLSPGGTLLLSVPFGRPADRGWQRIFGLEEVSGIRDDARWAESSLRVFRSVEDGWREVAPEAASDAGYNDPHEGGLRDAPSWVAAAEAVALLELKRP